MRKVFLTLLFVLFAVVAMAQSTKKVVIYTIPFVPEHDFRLSAGLLPATLGSSISDIYLYDKEDKILKTCSINFSYSYRTERWLEVGAFVSYNGIYRNGRDDRTTDSEMWKQNVTDISIVPMVRFSWYRSKYVRLYSAVGLGVVLSICRSQTGDYSDNSLSCGFAGQITAFGVSAGNKVFGFAEVGSFGSKGCAVLGIGYRFVDKKAKIDGKIKY